MPASPTETSQPVTPASLAAGNVALSPLAGDELQLWRFPLPLPDSPLRRAVESLPNATEHAQWLADVQAGRANVLNLIDSLLQSSEYAARF